MKIKKRLWALLLSAAMIITFLPAAAFATENEAASAVPVSAEYEGAALRGVVGTSRILSLESPAAGGNKFVVTFSDGSKKTFSWPEEQDASSDTYPEGAFIYDKNTYLYAEVYEDEDNPVSFKEGLNENVKLQLNIHYNANGEEALKSLTVKTSVNCTYDKKPLAIEFVPAEGFEPECTAGPNYLIEDLFYGEGNQFVVTYEGWNDAYQGYRVYKNRMMYFNKTDEEGNTWEGFALNGNPEKYGEFYLDDGVLCEPEFGEVFDATFSYTEMVPELDEEVSVSFTVPVKASKYQPYTGWAIYAYNGKLKTPSFKVFYGDDKLIDPAEYEVSCESASKMGWYDATITFKDKEKFVDSIQTFYGIGPAAPKVSKLVAGKKSLTVKWKKLTNAQLKNVDGFYIELATDKNFVKNYKHIYVNKKTVKAGKKLIKNLKKGKKYYVRMYAYKKITQDGEKFEMPSADSNVKYIKTK